MEQDLERRARNKRSFINLIGVLLLAAAAALVLLLFYQNTPELQAWYDVYQLRLRVLQDKVLELRAVGTWLLVAAVLALYALKCVVPLYPISFLCVLTSAIGLPMPVSLTVNVLGIVVLISLRYAWGRRRGGGGWRKLLSLNRNVRTFLEREGGKAKPWLLFFFRVTPNFPVNGVSQVYGSMRFAYADFMLISLLGFAPKLISSILLGQSWHNPLSNAFLIPLIIALALSGLSAIGINMALTSAAKKDKTQ